MITKTAVPWRKEEERFVLKNNIKEMGHSRITIEPVAKHNHQFGKLSSLPYMPEGIIDSTGSFDVFLFVQDSSSSSSSSPDTTIPYAQSSSAEEGPTLIDTLSEEQMREILQKMAAKFPSLVLDLCEDAAGAGVPGPGGPDPGPQPTPAWCVCSHCRDMPTDEERLCCGKRPEHCFSILPDMDFLILDPHVLHMQQLYRNDVFALHAVRVEDINKSSRHAAYRQFVLWQHGRLPEGVRRVIPSCCVWRIRDTFPDAQNTYTGYKVNRNG
ncbi:hypothetical protein ScPMuIL_000544 [Solemya velum]